MTRDERLELFLPGLRTSNWSITSEATDAYNCIAWALGETDRWWDPNRVDGYWPEGVDRDDQIATFGVAFASLGFEHCENADLETEFEKIALFADELGLTHVALQLPSGRWTSKIGEDEDIEHDLGALTTPPGRDARYRYGNIVRYMMRARTPRSI